MEFWQAIARTEVDQLVPVACLAEKLGFAGVTMSDHVVRFRAGASRYPYAGTGRMAMDETAPYPDPWVLCGALARATQRLRFMTYVYIPALRDPFSVAKAISTAALVSNDRVLMGVGVGWMEEEFALLERPFRQRGRRTDEMLDVIRKLFSGEMVEHHREFYDFDPVQMAPAPLRRPPILVGGHSPGALRRAAPADGRRRRAEIRDDRPASRRAARPPSPSRGLFYCLGTCASARDVPHPRLGSRAVRSPSLEVRECPALKNSSR